MALRSAGFRAAGNTLIPFRKLIAVAFDQRRADNQPEYGSAMVAGAGSCLSSMLRKPGPEFCAGACLQRMCADAHDARSRSRIAAVFPRLTKEISASLRPPHRAIALRKLSSATKSLLELIQ